MWLLFFLLGCPHPHALVSNPASSIEELATQIDSQAPQDMKLMFVISASRGSVERINETHHEFSFWKEDVTASIAFTDRPQRRSFDFSISVFKDMWEAGKDSFAKDPPNAVLKDTSSKIAITELIDFRVTGDKVTFVLDRNAYKRIDNDDVLGNELENPTLFIDSLITTAGVAGLLRAGAQACAECECYLWPLGG